LPRREGRQGRARAAGCRLSDRHAGRVARDDADGKRADRQQQRLELGAEVVLKVAV
jgi:hypothetical protein